MPEPGNVYSLIGFALVYLQSLERSVKMCTTYVLQDGEALDLAKLQQLQESDRRKTLGHFTRRIKERTSVHPMFEDLIDTVVRDRNDLVHNVDRIPGWSLEQQEGIEVATKFVTQLLHRAHFLNEVLVALSAQWIRQASLDVSTSAEVQAYIDNVEKAYGELIPTLLAHGDA